MSFLGIARFLNSGTTQPVTQAIGLPVTPIYGSGITAPSNWVSGCVTATDTAAHSVLGAPGAGLRNYLTGIMVSNSGSISSSVTIQSDPLGTPSTLAILENPSGGGNNPPGFLVPLVGGSNVAIGFTCGSASTTQAVTLIGYTGP